MTGSSDDPKAGPTSLEAIARALAGHLEHERRYKGVRYAFVSETVVEEPARAPHPPRKREDAPAPSTRPSPRPSAPSSEPPRAAASAESVAEVRARVIEEKAREWTPARKLEYLRERNVGDCRRCGLSRGRTHIVFGVGNPEAEIMFVGEAPGAEEDRRGEPFVGRAGQRLDAWLGELGLARRDVYIANVLKCRPPENRDPEPQEIERCSPFLLAQIRAIEPRVIVALGRFAGNMLISGGGPEATRASRTMRSMQGRVHEFVEPKSGRRTPLIVTYHPAYVLRRERPDATGRSENEAARKPENTLVLEDLQRAVDLARDGR